jgi:hypothetical protein
VTAEGTLRFAGEEPGDSGGADIEARLGLRCILLDRGFAGRTGDEDSLPDWKMFVSSHGLSSAPVPILLEILLACLPLVG